MEMEAPRPPDMTALLDLEQVAAERRAAIWCGTAPSLFPGLSVARFAEAPQVGNIRRMALGSGSLWAITSAPAAIKFKPAPAAQARDPSFSTILQLAGSLRVRQEGHVCRTGAGDLCFVDESLPFELESTELSDFLVLRLSRSAVLDRNPHLRGLFACRVDCHQPAAEILGDTLLQAVRTAPFLDGWQRQRIAAAMTQMIGIAGPGPQDGVRHWRVEAALACIEQHSRDGDLDAEGVARAQGISRRRLDQLMKGATGRPISAYIWERRLEQAAFDLSDRNHHGRTVAAIAYANGFTDAAHFSRAFKTRFGKSPLAWREAAAERVA